MSQDRRATRRDGPDCWCTRLAVAPDTGREELAAAAARDVGMDAGRGHDGKHNCSGAARLVLDGTWRKATVPHAKLQ